MADDTFVTMAWSLMLDGMQFDHSLTAENLRAQYLGRVMTRANGPSLPLALFPGQEPIKPMFLTTPGEWVERGMGKLLFMRG